MERLTFGKYTGRLIRDIIRIDPKYIRRLVKIGRIKLPKGLRL